MPPLRGAKSSTGHYGMREHGYGVREDGYGVREDGYGREASL